MHQQFDLNVEMFRTASTDAIERVKEIPSLVEELTKDLIKRGYIVIESSSRYMGIPQSITVVKDFTGPFVLKICSEAKEDFKKASRALGLERLFE